jgi:hypothetical protein
MSGNALGDRCIGFACAGDDLDAQRDSALVVRDQL